MVDQEKVHCFCNKQYLVKLRLKIQNDLVAVIPKRPEISPLKIKKKRIPLKQNTLFFKSFNYFSSFHPARLVLISLPGSNW